MVQTTNDITTLHFFLNTSCSSKTKVGGWSNIAVGEQGDIIDIKEGYEVDTTSNRLQLLAFTSVLEQLQSVGASRKHIDVIVHTTSDYLQGTFMEWYQKWQQNGWKTATGRMLENQDLLRTTTAQYIKVRTTYRDISIVTDKDQSNSKFFTVAATCALKWKLVLESESDKKPICTYNNFDKEE